MPGSVSSHNAHIAHGTCRKTILVNRLLRVTLGHVNRPDRDPDGVQMDVGRM